MPASTSCRTARRRCSGDAVPGSSFVADRFVHRRHAHVTRRTGRIARRLQQVASRTTIGPLVTIENGVCAAASISRQPAREPVVAFDRLVRVGRRADRHAFRVPMTRLAKLARERLRQIAS